MKQLLVTRKLHQNIHEDALLEQFFTPSDSDEMRDVNLSIFYSYENLLSSLLFSVGLFAQFYCPVVSKVEKKSSLETNLG